MDLKSISDWEYIFNEGELALDDSFQLVCISEKYWNEFFQVRIENQLGKGFYEEREHQEIEWKGMKSDDSIYCFVIERKSNNFIGYCSVSRIKAGINEISIELLKKYTGKGYGQRVISLFIDALSQKIGMNSFIAVVAPENKASQSLMKKINAKPEGIKLSIWLKDKTGERAWRFEEKYLAEIDEFMVQLAEEFEVEPRKLLSHNLVYRISV